MIYIGLMYYDTDDCDPEFSLISSLPASPGCTPGPRQSQLQTRLVAVRKSSHVLTIQHQQQALHKPNIWLPNPSIETTPSPIPLVPLDLPSPMV